MYRVRYDCYLIGASLFPRINGELHNFRFSRRHLLITIRFPLQRRRSVARLVIQPGAAILNDAFQYGEAPAAGHLFFIALTKHILVHLVVDEALTSSAKSIRSPIVRALNVNIKGLTVVAFGHSFGIPPPEPSVMMI